MTLGPPDWGEPWQQVWDMLVWVSTGGSAWPEADEDRIRQLAQAWRDAGTHLHQAIVEAGAERDALAESWAGPSGLAFQAGISGLVDQALPQIAQLTQQVAQEADQAALDVEYEKLTVLIAVTTCCLEIFAIIVAAFFTFGAALAAAAVPIGIARTAIAAALRLLLSRAAQSLGQLALREAMLEALQELATDLTAQGLQVAMGNRSDWDADKTLWSGLAGAGAGALGAGTAPLTNLLGRRAPNNPLGSAIRTGIDGVHEAAVETATNTAVTGLRTGEWKVDADGFANSALAEGARGRISDSRDDALERLGQQVPALPTSTPVPGAPTGPPPAASTPAPAPERDSGPVAGPVGSPVPPGTSGTGQPSPPGTAQPRSPVPGQPGPPGSDQSRPPGSEQSSPAGPDQPGQPSPPNPGQPPSTQPDGSPPGQSGGPGPDRSDPSGTTGGGGRPALPDPPGPPPPPPDPVEPPRPGEGPDQGRPGEGPGQGRSGEGSGPGRAGHSTSSGGPPASIGPVSTDPAPTGPGAGAITSTSGPAGTGPPGTAPGGLTGPAGSTPPFATSGGYLSPAGLGATTANATGMAAPPGGPGGHVPTAGSPGGVGSGPGGPAGSGPPTGAGTPGTGTAGPTAGGPSATGLGSTAPATGPSTNTGPAGGGPGGGPAGGQSAASVSPTGMESRSVAPPDQSSTAAGIGLAGVAAALRPADRPGPSRPAVPSTGDPADRSPGPTRSPTTGADDLDPASAWDERELSGRVPVDGQRSPVLHPDPRHPTRWVGYLNDGGPGRPGRATNCTDTVRAFLSTWYGRPSVAGALNRDPSRGVAAGTDRTQRWLGADFVHQGAGSGGLDSVGSQLLGRGHGAATVIISQWADGGSHMWVAVNHTGTVVWVEPQTGRLSDEAPLYQGQTDQVWSLPLDANGEPVSSPYPDGTVAPPVRPEQPAVDLAALAVRTIDGDDASARELVRRMGRWEEGIKHLTAGTDFAAAIPDEQRQRLVEALVDHRQRLYESLPAELGVRPFAAGSTNPGSDVDLEVRGPDAGRRLLAAERILATGDPQWREHYRMGVLVHSERVAGSVDALDQAPPERAAPLRQELLRAAETLVLARRLRFASGPAERAALVAELPTELHDQVRQLANSSETELTRLRTRALHEADRHHQAALAATDPLTRARHLVGAAREQLVADYADDEAYVSVGGKRRFAFGAQLERISERRQAVLDQLMMIAHIFHEEQGGVGSLRRYETWKYVLRVGDVLDASTAPGSWRDFAINARAKLPDGRYGVDQVSDAELSARYAQFTDAVRGYADSLRSPLPGRLPNTNLLVVPQVATPEVDTTAPGDPEGAPFEFAQFVNDPRWAAEATEFEQRLGAHYFNDPQAVDAARTAVRQLRDVLVALNGPAGGDGSPVDAVRRVEEAFFRSDKPDFAGQAGAGVALDDLIARGNLRELLTAFFNAAYFNRRHPTLANTLLDVLDNGRWAEAEAAGLDLGTVGRTRDQLEGGWNRGARRLESGLNRTRWDGKRTHRFDRDPLATGNAVMRSENGLAALADVVSSQWRRRPRDEADRARFATTPAHYAQLGTPLGEFERAYLERHLESTGGGPLTEETPLPWREGAAVHDNTSTLWARIFGDQGFPLVAGVSGTTTLMMMATSFLGQRQDQREQFLNALLGWMLPGRNHSLLETLWGARIAGVDRLTRSDAGTSFNVIDLHRTLAGLDLGTLRTAVARPATGPAETAGYGLLPHESRYLDRATDPDGLTETRHPVVRETAGTLWSQLASGRISDPDTGPRIERWLHRNGIDPADPAAVRGLADRLSLPHVLALTVYTGHGHHLINNVTRTHLWTGGLSDPVTRALFVRKTEDLVAGYLREVADGATRLPELPQLLFTVLREGRLGELNSASPLNPLGREWLLAARRSAEARQQMDDASRSRTRSARAAKRAADLRVDESWRAVRARLRAVAPRLFDEMRWHADMLHDAVSQLPAVGTPDSPLLAFRGDRVTPAPTSRSGPTRLPHGRSREFLRLSRRLDVATTSMSGNASGSGTALLVYRLVGRYARDISVFSSSPDQDEVLLPPDSRTRRVRDPELERTVRDSLPEADREHREIIVVEEA